MVPDWSRALTFVSTQGREGLSPYHASDVLTRLAQRGHTAKLKTVSLREMVFAVDGKEVFIREGERTDEFSRWFYAKIGNGFVRFNGIRMAKCVPTLFIDSTGKVFDPFPALQADWMRLWPKAGATWHTLLKSWGVESTGGVGDMPFLSEDAFCEAIELVLQSPRWT